MHFKKRISRFYNDLIDFNDIYIQFDEEKKKII